jgi:hypothetical protein
MAFSAGPVSGVAIATISETTTRLMIKSTAILRSRSMREAYVRWGSAGEVLGIGGLTAPEVGSGCVDDSLRTGAGSVGRGEVMGFGVVAGHMSQRE